MSRVLVVVAKAVIGVAITLVFMATVALTALAVDTIVHRTELCLAVH